MSTSSPNPTPTFAKSLTEAQARTKRLLLRPLRVSDAEDIFLLRSNHDVMQWTAAPAVETTVQQSTDWLQTKVLSKPDQAFNFAIELLPGASSAFPSLNSSEWSSTSLGKPGHLIGLIGAIRGPEIGYMIHPAFWGQGVASEALTALVQLFWEYIPAAPIKSAAEPTPESANPTNIGTSTATTTNATTAINTPADPRIILGGVSSPPPPAPPQSLSPLAAALGLIPSPLLSTGHNHIEACTDLENHASRRILEKCGFKLHSITKDDFQSAFFAGLRSTVVYRLARPGV